ncbi:hypothetical protein BH18THE2_BH18THE2_39760 [soil metagenome]
MSAMDGFEVYNEIKKIDTRVKVCFIQIPIKLIIKLLSSKNQELKVKRKHHNNIVH